MVLADGNTASSAEIVTGAIQDADRGKVVGEKTFGTGTVLGRFDLADGSSLRIGVERWLTRDGRPIWHEGLEPDVKVALADTVQPLRPRRPPGHDGGAAGRLDGRAAAQGPRGHQDRELVPGRSTARTRARPEGNQKQAAGEAEPRSVSAR